MRPRPDADRLRAFQATSLELVALGDAILFYINWMQNHPQEVKPIQREVAALLLRFQNRLVEQLDSSHGLPV